LAGHALANRGTARIQGFVPDPLFGAETGIVDS
jgi:hypothetical protein